MAKGITIINIPMNNYTPQKAEELIQGWLAAHEFQYKQENGETYFEYGDGIVTAFKGFQYLLYPQRVELRCWMGKKRKARQLEGFYGAIWIEEYKKDLDTLSRALSALNQNGMPQQNNPAPIPNQSPPNPYPPQQNPYTAPISSPQQPHYTNPAPPPDIESIRQQVDKKKANCALAGFILSLVMLIMLFFGWALGLPVAIVAIWLCCYGLKSSRKGLAVAGIVITCIESVLLLVLAFLNALIG